MGFTGHLAHFERLTMCHVLGAELVKHELMCGPWVTCGIS